MTLRPAAEWASALATVDNLSDTLRVIEAIQRDALRAAADHLLWRARVSMEPMHFRPEITQPFIDAATAIESLIPKETK